MTMTEQWLTAINQIVNHAGLPYDVGKALVSLRDEMEQELRHEVASSRGVGNAAKTIASILKAADKNGRRALAYPWIDGKNRQCICDGYTAFRLTEHLPLPERPDNVGDGIDLDKLCPKDTSGMKELALPTIAEVKTEIAVQRSKYEGKSSSFTPYWDFGPEAPTVNAQFLLNVLTVIKDATKALWNTMLTPLYIAGSNGDALLLPIRVNGKTAPAPKTPEEAAAIERERQQNREFNAEIAERDEIIRKARNDEDAAREARSKALDKQRDIMERMKKATSSGIISELADKLLDARHDEAVAFLTMHNARLKIDPNTSIEFDQFVDVMNKYTRQPIEA